MSREGGNRAVVRTVEENDGGARRRCEDSRSTENVGVARDLSQRCERSDAGETGRGRRELQEPQDEGRTRPTRQSNPAWETSTLRDQCMSTA